MEYFTIYIFILLQRVALDCLSYHATATDNDTTWLARETIPVSKEFNLYSYKFNDTLYQDSITLKIVIRMFLDFDLINKFSIPYKVRFRTCPKTFSDMTS